MAKEAQIFIRLDSSKAQKSVKDLDKEVKDFGTTTLSLKAQLKAMTIELQNMSEGDSRFASMTIEAGKLRDKIADTNAVIQATAGSAVEN